MAPPAGTLRVGRYFLALAALIALLYSIVFFGSRHTPKLATDLAGGTEVIFKAKTENGGPPPSSSMEQAKQILTERVNGTGVTNATVVVEGSDRIVVTIPGQTTTDVNKLGKAAVLNFRGVVAPPVPVTCTYKTSGAGSASQSPSAGPSTAPASSGHAGSSPAKASPAPSNSGAAASVRPLSKPSGSAATSGKPHKSATTSPKASTSPTTSPLPSTSPSSAPQAPHCRADSVKLAAQAGKFEVPLKDTDFDKLPQSSQQLLQAGLAAFDCRSASTEKDLPDSYFIACAPGAEYGVAAKKVAFLLGPVIVAGKQIDTADALAPNASQGQLAWSVQLSLKGSGQSAWADYTSAHNVAGDKNAPAVTQCSASGTACANYVAFTLDGSVISAPVNIDAINGQNTQITGNFTDSSANALANQLKYGALPLSFKVESDNPTSATLGSAQLKAGLLAGGIGLALVVIYSLIYYRALGLVTIASLLVSGALTYASLVMLGTQIGFTLSLAGIAGFIVAVGITADSFVVFFERLKDEVHEGRSVRVAVPRAWARARRTILSADTVSFLAAAILYYFAAGDVKGFAFTLGLSTILDLVVVFLFTHPLISLLSRSAAFGSARFTGLDSLRGAPAPADERPATRSARRSGAQAAADPRETATAVLTEPDREEIDEAGVADVVDDVDAVDEEPTDDPSAERRRTAPESGSAAERAAARRARLRQQKSGGEDER
ncbi:MAG TPA: protein translocase subunit SecD [Jatrophihabitans sp.]